MKTLDILRKLQHDHRTIKRFVADSEHRQVCADKGALRKISARFMHQIKRAAAKMQLHSSKQILEAAGALESHGYQGVESSRVLHLCINHLFGHHKPMLTSRNDCIGQINT